MRTKTNLNKRAAIDLDSAVKELLCDISSMLGKQNLQDSDLVALNDGKQIECKSFWKLRNDEYFDAWLIYACMQISDKPSFVNIAYSIPLDRTDKKGRMFTISRPFLGLRTQLDKLRKEFEATSEEQLIMLCPVNWRNKHFSLLEFNESERKIYHYDSSSSVPALRDEIKGRSRVGTLIQVSYLHEVL